MEQKHNIQTDAELKPTPKRMNLSTQSLPSLNVSSGQIYEEYRRELQYPACIGVYQQMMLEPTLASALSLIEIMIARSKWTAVVPEGSSEEEKTRAKIVNWSMNNMARPWEDYISEFTGFLQWGFQPIEKVYTKLKDGEYKGTIVPKDLKSISPTTISKWIYENKTKDLVGVRQDFSKIGSDFNKNTPKSYVDIPRTKFMLFRNGVKLNNPQGISPLRSCYISWKQKTVASDYLLIGIARDLGGTPVIGVDVDFLTKASEEGSEEALTLAEMDRQAANLHAGEQTFIRKPISYDDRGNPLFTFDLIGVSGSSGKQYDPLNLVESLESKMQIAFLVDVLSLGTKNGGSYSLAESKTTLMAMGVESHLKNIQKTLNKEFIKQIYSLNNWEYNDETSVKFSYSDIESVDLESLSKFIQRTVSVGALRPTKELEDYLLESMGVEVREEGDMNFIETEATSRAGEGDGTSGTGSKIQDKSDNNLDNSK